MGGPSTATGYLAKRKNNRSFTPSFLSVLVTFLLCISCWIWTAQLSHVHTYWHQLLRSFKQRISYPPSLDARHLAAITTNTTTTTTTTKNQWTAVAELFSSQSSSLSISGLGQDYLWSQNVGLHHMEYYEKDGVCHSLPPGRSGHTVVGYGVNSSGFLHSKRSLLSSRNSYLLTFGGRLGQGAKKTYSRGRSQLLNDTWLFVSGVANTTDLAAAILDETTSMRTIRQVVDPYTGESCFEDPAYPTDSSTCTACNRWHRIPANARSRWTSECQRDTATVGFVAPIWCTYPTSTKLSAAPTSLNRSGHASSLVSLNAQPEDGVSATLIFGGETRGTSGTGETFDNDVWYLAGVSAAAPSRNQNAEWRCLETFSQYDPFPGTDPVPSASYCSSTGGEEIQTGMGGIIGTGTLTPLQSCTWTLKNDTAHAIVLDVTTLDLDHATLCRAGMLEVYDGIPSTSTSISTDTTTTTPSRAILLARGCSLEAGESSWDNARFTAFSGAMTIKIRYESPCSNHDGFRATYSTIASVNDTSIECPATCPSAIPCLDVCNGRGDCIHGSCGCHNGYYGINCEHTCSNMGACDKLAARKTGVSISGLGFPPPRRGHTAVSVKRDTMTSIHSRWSDTATDAATPIVASSTTEPCPLISSSNITTLYTPLELSNAGVVTELSSTETTYTFEGVEGRVVKKIETKSITSGHRRVLFFGGELRHGAGMSNELWSLDLQQPAPSANSACIASSLLEVSLVDGACSITTNRCDTYPIDYRHFPRPPLHNQWTKWLALNQNEPPARAGHTSVIMPTSNVMIVFGGRSASGAVLDDLWGLNVSSVSEKKNGVVGTESITSNYAQWFEYDAVGHRSEVTSVMFDGQFAATVSHDGTLTVGQDDRVTLRLSDNLLVLNRQHVFESNPSSRQFRCISKRSDLGRAAYTGVAEIFPRARTDHVASVIELDAGETMIVYGGVGAGPKLLKDVWRLTIDASFTAKWEQVQKSWGNYLAAGYGASLLHFPDAMSRHRYSGAMVPVVSSINMGKDGIDANAYIKESLLVFGGVNEKKVPDGFNHDYNTMWRSRQYYQGGRNPLLFYMCPDADV